MKVRLWHIAVFLIALVVFAGASAPASFFAPRPSETFAYERAGGTVWRARFENVRLGPYDARAMSWRLSPLDLVQGKARLPLTFEDGAIEGEAMLLANWHGDRRIVASSLRLEGAALGSLHLPGETTIEGLDIFFDGGRCAQAAGSVQSDVLTRAGAALGWPGPPLAGAAVCEGEDGRILLSGVNGLGDQVTVSVDLRGDGAVLWRARVQTTTPEAAAALAAAGFAPDGDGLVKNGEGRWLPF